MLSLSINLVILLACGALASENQEEKRIINGNNAQLYAHPYILSFQFNNNGTWSHVCGAVLLSPTKAVTAAHCLDGFGSYSKRVVAGALHLSETTNYQQVAAVSREIIHESYDGQSIGFPNDVGVLYLATPIVFNSNVQPVSLPTSANQNFDGVKCIISGWGKTSPSSGVSPHLQEARVSIITLSSCRNKFGFITGLLGIKSTHICAHEESVNAASRPRGCNGDSGGPLVCGQYLAGITSFGAADCPADYPVVYTRISSYLSWIASK